MKARVFGRIAGVPITPEVIPLSLLIGGIVGLGIYTGITRLRDPHYIRLKPTHSWKDR
ncbi:hypothetical protein COEREDRAFT_81351 [Coemansia reversa NRRL 1564]|uniref:Uncharacterized protein n=1 Tax=Coemansia reversa (strain ATCC 12441 / NRRL 1564) TaxID=763665 RepID=A0A2G5BBL8_COERN|nr:hypothetical protein COEREDRAFT_81351 [Coemansia reversa NRRL 1564]|eukprot:PIA16400.1 hypothetical protein COEREDRAFT_81351 [Coemansia reversa NRRL 1564]